MTDLAKQANESLAVELGFLMQNVKSVSRLQNITVRPDPVFFKFTEKRDLQSRNLVLKVRQFLKAAFSLYHLIMDCSCH